MGFDRRSFMRGGLAGAVLALSGSLVKIGDSTALVPAKVELVASPPNDGIPIRLPVRNIKRIELRREVVETTSELDSFVTAIPGPKSCYVEAYGLQALDPQAVLGRVVQIHLGREAFSLSGGVITGRLVRVNHFTPTEGVAETHLTLSYVEFTWSKDDPIVAKIINLEIDGEKIATAVMEAGQRALKA